VGITAGSREVPGRKPVTRDNNNNIIIIIISLIIYNMLYDDISGKSGILIT
jgi:hypothetical protein